MRSHKYFLLMSVLVGVFCLLVSCRGIGPQKPTEERLKTRVEAYLAARIDRKLETMKQFCLQPEAARLGNIYYLEGKIDKLRIDGETAEVVVKNTFKVMGFTFRDTPQKQAWVWRDGDWYLVSKAKNPFRHEPKQ
jgi:hypothetical protein